MPLTKIELDRALRLDDERVVIALFADADEGTRKVFAPQVKEWWHTLDLNREAQYDPMAQARLSPGQMIPNYHHLYPTAYAAALACLNLAEVKAVQFNFGLDDEVAEILAARRAPWVADYCTFLCAHRFGSVAHVWRQVRALVRAGLCPPPSHENYALGAIEGIRPIYNYRRNQRRSAEGLPPLPELALEEHLLRERDWLDTAFWKLFEFEGNSRVSLANRGFAWIEAVVALSRREIIDRNRLLDASLGALNRDFMQFRVRWFAQLHEALAPTAAERAARLDTYLSLLGSHIPPTVTFAMEAIVAIDVAKPIPASALLPALSPVLASRGKAVVKNALQLLAQLAERDPASRREVCHAATTALLHPAPELQKAVFLLLDRYGEKADSKLRDRLLELKDAVAASLRPRLNAWLDAPANPFQTGSGPPVSLAPPQTSPSPDSAATKPASTLDPARAIVPIATLDELLDRAAAVMEAPDDPNEIERVLDGICRLCDQRPPDFERRIGPLSRRALTMLSRFQSGPGSDPTMDRAIAGAILCWLAGNNLFAEAPHLIGGQPEPFAFLFRRLAAIGKFVGRRRALPLLSAPTHRGGWIEPQALVARWIQWQDAGATPDRHEQVVALLRLAPEQRAAALPAAERIAGEAGVALRFALGENVAPTGDVALALAAYRSRTPVGDLPAFEFVFPDVGPDGGRAARYHWRRKAGVPERGAMTLGCGFELSEVQPPLPSNADEALLPVLLNHRGEYMEGVSRSLLRWTAYLWPAHREGLLARGIPALQIAVEWSDTRDRETCGYLDALLDFQAPLGPMATLALALGLAAQDVALRGLAQEALIAAIQEQRVDAIEMGAVLSRMWDTGLGKLARLAKSFAEVARISPQHAFVVAELVRRTLHGDSARAPRELGAMLELLVELQIETAAPLSDPRTRDYLAAITGTGKSARLAKQLLKT